MLAAVALLANGHAHHGGQHPLEYFAGLGRMTCHAAEGAACTAKNVRLSCFLESGNGTQLLQHGERSVNAATLSVLRLLCERDATLAQPLG